MLRWPVVRLIAYITLLSGFVRLASGSEILIADAKSSPESLAAGPDGTLFIGSASKPFVYKVRSGTSTADIFVDASADGAGSFFFGVLADAASNTLWTCELTPTAKGASSAGHQSTLRGFDLSTGAQKLHWKLPGDNNVCNDFSVGPAQALYITDTINGRIYKLAAGTTIPELFFEDAALFKGVDGITFLDGKLYVTNVFTSKLYYIPVNADGKAGYAVELFPDQPLSAPDGMRAMHRKLLVADSGDGKIEALTVNGDHAHVVMIKDGLNMPTAVEPTAGGTVWVTERGAGKAVSIVMPK